MLPCPLRSALAAVAALVVARTDTASAQSVDLFPSNRPFGTDQELFQVYDDSTVRFDFALPGLTHEESLAVSPQWLTLFAYAPTALPVPVPLGPQADLLINPVGLVLNIVPSATLEIEAPLDLNLGGSMAQLFAQVAAIDLLDPALTLQASELITLQFLEPPHALGEEMRPLGADAPGSTNVFFDATENAYKFQFDDGIDPVEYVIDMDEPKVTEGLLHVYESYSGTWVCYNGGFYFAQGAGQALQAPWILELVATQVIESVQLDGNTLTVVVADVFPPLAGDFTRRKEYRYTLVGRSLRIEANSLETEEMTQDTYFGFWLGSFLEGSSTTIEPRRVPYQDKQGLVLIDDTYYASSSIDLFQSGANRHTPAEFNVFTGQEASFTEQVFYRPDLEGNIGIVSEVGWVTVSQDVQDCFIQTTAGRSPYSDEVEDKTAIWFTSNPNANPNAYADDLEAVQRFLDWGFEDVISLRFNWRFFGSANRSSTHYPANPNGGTDEQFAEVQNLIADSGWIGGLYGEFYALDHAPFGEPNPNYSEAPGSYLNYEDGVIGQDGEYLAGFQGFWQPTQTLWFTRVLSPLRAVIHMEREANLIIPAYGTRHLHLDVSCINTPDNLVLNGLGGTSPTIGCLSYDPTTYNDSNLREAIGSIKNLIDRASLVYQGPVSAEGSFFDYKSRFDSFYAGHLDAIWRSISSGGNPSDPATLAVDELIVPDYEIQVVRPKTAGLFGMGVLDRFIPLGDELPYDDINVQQLRATQISYMHNGYIQTSAINQVGGDDYTTYAQQAKEYYTMSSLHEEWKDAGSATIRYRKGAPGSPWVDLSTALKDDTFDLSTPVLQVTYSSGLTMIVNHHAADVTEAGYTIPEFGWVITNPSTGYRNLSVRDDASGQTYDEVWAPNYVMVDGNGTARNFGPGIGTHTNLHLLRTDLGFELDEQGDGSLLKQ
ncbi:MAG: hypothetical protein ACYS26_14715 [Planctomycetota bacterium]|jgi:hypothetical protein